MGPFARAVTKAISEAQRRRNDPIIGDFTVYRGLKLPAREISREFKEGKEIRLKNFTSTSKHKDIALNFALSD